MANADYKIWVDWDNNGNFTGTYDDITSDVKDISFSRGKDSELGTAQVGNLSVTVENAGGKYSPELVAGDLYGNLLPRRPINVKAIVANDSSDVACLAGWKKRVRIAIDQTNISGETNFPVYVPISTASGVGDVDVSCIFDEVGDESLKIAVTEPDGVTECYVEVVSWDSVTEYAELWVNVADPTSNIYLYYDSTHADNSSYVGVVGSTPGKAVWDANFVAVYHMNDVTTSTIADSTGANNGTKKGANEPVEAAGLVGEAQSFDGSNDYINLGSPLADWNIDWTIETMSTHLVTGTAYEGIWGTRFGAGEANWITFGFADTGSRITVEAGTAGETYIVTNYDDRNQGSLLWSLTNISKIVSIYKNGVFNKSGDLSVRNFGTNNLFYLGRWYTTSQIWDGLFDEVRISNIARSATWIASTNQTLTDALLTFGSEENIYDLFYGYIEEIIPHPHLSEQDCVITAMDGLDFLARHDLDTALYTDVATGTVHGYILDSAGWAAGMRTLDTGGDTIPFWYSWGEKARNAQLKVDQSELGFSYIDGAGNFVFEDRRHRYTQTHQTSQATFSDTMVGISYQYTPKNIYNEITATVTPWTLVTPAVDLWTLDEVPFIPAGETLTWWGNAEVDYKSVFVANWVEPTTQNEILRPDGAGDEENIGTPTGTHWQSVDDVTQDGHTTYISTQSSSYERDLYTIGAPSGSGVINYVRVYFLCYNGDINDPAYGKAAIKSGATTDDGDENTINFTGGYATFYHEWTLNPDDSAAWEWADITSLQIGVSLKFTGQAPANVRCTQVYAEVNYTDNIDMTANSQADGLGTDMTSDISISTTKLAKTIKLELTNNGAVGAFITLLKARGTYYDNLSTITRKSSDATSQTNYQKRTLSVQGEFMTDANLAQSFCDFALARYKDPQAQISITIVNKTDALLTQILSRQISDRITITNTKLGMSRDFFIDSMSHNISISGLYHTATFWLSSCLNEDFWCLDFSALGTQTKLGY